MRGHESGGTAGRRGASPVFRIGVAGHRALPGADLGALAAVSAGQLLRHLEAVRSRDPAAAGEVRCVSSLAEGADTLLAEAALALGLALEAPLPFPRDLYALDFASGEARARYLALLARARVVVEAEVGGDREASYEAAARRLLDSSDVLLAIWDGLPERGRGGTGQVVREALARDMPVTVIAPTPPHAARELAPRAEDLPR